MDRVNTRDSEVYSSATSLNLLANAGGIHASRRTIYHSAEDLSEIDEKMSEEANLCSETHSNPKQITRFKSVEPKPVSTMFRDGKTTVDFILAWWEPIIKAHLSHEAKAAALSQLTAAKQKRETFERNLKEEGLILEYEFNNRLNFVKIHAPREVLKRYCEILKLRMRMKDFPEKDELFGPHMDLMNEVTSFISKNFLSFVCLDEKVFPKERFQPSAEYSRDRSYLFDDESEDFFSGAIRTLVVDFILERQRFIDDPSSVAAIGIQRLISENVYCAAYPLHDGDYKTAGSLRNLLYVEWAQVGKWIKHQPIDQIKEYFGVKYGLYFAWLGFYTHMLIPASIVGVVCFLYGIFTLHNDTLSNDICNTTKQIIMCPLCDGACDYWKLAETCTYARITYLFDNPVTVVFAIFMSFWATLFLELWKRYSASIAHRWGLTGFTLQAEHPRPQFLTRLSGAKKYRVNVITGVKEPYAPFWTVRVPATLLSFSVVLLLIILAIATVFGVILYRMSVKTVLASLKWVGENEWTTTHTLFLVPTSAAIINLVFIMALNYVYDKLAVYLTELELLRTQTEFDESLTVKIYLFQFVNYYSSIMYIAFLKGKFVGYPKKYNRIFGFRQEECNPGGCLMELCIQLGIIMVGQQTFNTILEMVLPLVYKWWTTLMISTGLESKNESEDVMETMAPRQWTEDYKLVDWGPRGLFYEYLEVVMQYGFITIFVAAFPLAPLFALLNNIFEMRLDAKKFLTFYRRPVPKRAPNIGVWFMILDVLGKLAVISNAFIIAFSSNFIPKLVYRISVSEDHSDRGFLNHTLAYFDVKDFTPPHNTTYKDIDHCRYAEYREPPSGNYKRPLIYWKILAARLLFVVVFQNIVSVVMLAVQWLIPDVPSRLGDQIKHEALLTNELIIKQEAKRASKRARSSSRQDSNLSDGSSSLRHRHEGAVHSSEEIELQEMPGKQNDIV
ncbi:hypothetical protein LSTR_LSTR011589 [Laodelphax striatellus]|uniref:Anoctamin n=1 Tax=Laodelphax striatellus TaxID=195883 RepID=A0A482X6U4_LAOST|nr:hypothetical protein LSTR_LSTR011589 [Laodelphax striatellus]